MREGGTAWRTLWRAVDGGYVDEDEVPCTDFNVQVVNGIKYRFHDRFQVLRIVTATVINAKEDNCGSTRDV